MKLLIVDDEVIIRTGLSTVIPWRESGYELLEPAASAEEALLRVPVEKPDIVLTDIQMTGKTGLELAGEVKRMLPDSEIIILTGYDQFHYAQQAIREGVSDYLLKSSRPEEIMRAVNGAKQRIITRREEHKRDHIGDALLNRLLSGNEIDDRMLEQVPKLLPKLKAGEAHGFQTVILCASGWGESSSKGQLLLFAVHNMAGEVIEGEVLLRDDVLLLILRQDEKKGALARFAKTVEQMEIKLKCQLFAAAGSIVPELRQLKRSCAEAAMAQSFRAVLPEEKILTYEQIKGRKGGRTVCTNEEEGQLTNLFQAGEVDGLRKWVDQLHSAQIADPETTPESLNAFNNSVLISAHRWVERVLAAYGATTGKAQVGFTPLPRSSTAENSASSLFNQLCQLMSQYRENSGQEGIPYIKRAIAYIHAHLDKELTLQQVAKHVHLNPNHFSEVFKRETGHTYIEYVTHARIDLAKRMLDESPIKVSEVASRVGYADIKYFSQLFKRHTGCTPTEYRSRT